MLGVTVIICVLTQLTNSQAPHTQCSGCGGSLLRVLLLLFLPLLLLLLVVRVCCGDHTRTLTHAIDAAALCLACLIFCVLTKLTNSQAYSRKLD